MAKKTEVGGFISPANLWGKPLPNITGSKPAPAKKEQKEERTKRMLADEDDDIDSDVDAELEETEELVAEDGTELLEEDGDDAAYIEAAAEEATAEEDVEEEVDGYAPEDGDVAEDGEVEAEEAVDEDPAPVPVTAGAKKKVSNMSEKKSGADHIRDEIAKRNASGESVRGVDIVAALAKRKIEVSPAQVSQLLKKAGLGGASRGGKKLVAAGEDKSRTANKVKKPTAETPRMLPKARISEPSATLPMAQLKAASAFLAACDGNYGTAGEILTAHKQLNAVMAH